MDAGTRDYLGDGVYVRYDGGGIVLTTEDGITVTNTIYLDYDVYKALTQFVDKITEPSAKK